MKNLFILIISTSLLFGQSGWSGWSGFPDYTTNSTCEEVDGNLIINGNMEIDDNWNNTANAPTTNERSTEIVHDANPCLFSRKVVTNANYSGIRSDVFTTENATYTVTYWIYPIGCTHVREIIRMGDDSDYNRANTKTGLIENQWNEVTFEFTESNAGAGAWLELNSSNISDLDTRYIDDVSIVIKP